MELSKAGGDCSSEVISQVITSILSDGEEPSDVAARAHRSTSSKQRPKTTLQLSTYIDIRGLHGRPLAHRAEQQSVDQAGFRSGCSCDDHLLTLALLREKMREHGVDLRLAAVDFGKASDP
eukprot:6671805-Pyramimonas_sp.AAC.1